MKALVLFMLLLLLCTALAQDCSRHCYAGAATFAEGPVANFNFGFVPCLRSLDGQIEQLALTQFTCQAPFASVLQIGFSTQVGELPFYSLMWNYNTTMSCDDFLSGGLSSSASNFILSTYTYTSLEIGSIVTSGTSLQALETSCGQDCAAHCFDFSVLANEGTAGVSSACGPEGTTTCSAEIQFTLTPCTALISALDVLIGPERTSLHAIDPAKLLNANFECNGDGVLVLNTAGLFVQWMATSLPCEILMNNVVRYARGGVAQFALSFGDEMWQNVAAQGAQTSLAMSVCAPVVKHDEDNQTLSGDTLPNSYFVFPSKHAVHVSVACSHRFKNDTCCTVFGYRNDNNHKVFVPRVAGENYFTPHPVDREQTALFHGETDEPEAFRVIWPCHKYERTIITWSVKHRAILGDQPWTHAQIENGDVTDPPFDFNTEHFWFRQASTTRTRNDCTKEQKIQWCGLPQEE